MSTESGDPEEEISGEGHKSEKGEGEHLSYRDFEVEEVIVPKSMTFKEASSCLHMLGKDESGMRYAYLMITCTNRKLTEISVLLQFVHVLFLDLAGNKLNLEGLNILEAMPYLLFLKADRNIVESAAMNPCSLLQILNISRNKIINTKGIKQPMVECLDLNYNYIDEVEFVQEDVPNLKLLELRGNLLNALTGIYPPSLDSLYLAQNRIQSIDESTLECLINLRILHLRENVLHKLDGFSPYLSKLKYLNLRRNQITKLKEFRKLCLLPALETLVVSQNPVGGDDAEQAGEAAAEEDEEVEAEEEEKLDPFRLAILVILPNLKRINKRIVTAHERVTAELQRKERYMDIMSEVSSVDEQEEEEHIPEEQSVEMLGEG